MSDEAEVTVTVVDGVRIVRVSGDFDPDEATLLSGGLVPAPDDSVSGTVVDLARVRFADSSFLHALLTAQGEHDRDGRPLVLAHVPPLVLRLLDLTDIARVFTLADHVPAAAELVRSGRSGSRRQ
ncbi:STAS domain-containing protein [Streptomyces sp. J2-1]|uniref:STAS domain-containing protein n=1 Tax=Streptomyces corallincola TaxID=2851888 RepID=UPI001C392561|nr:STAS domain-containing protein [Streptomyces corallincola]MBV2354120.1 STAS domain-containing protein [Streptomyces corallincola]